MADARRLLASADDEPYLTGTSDEIARTA